MKRFGPFIIVVYLTSAWGGYIHCFERPDVPIVHVDQPRYQASRDREAPPAVARRWRFRSRATER